MQNRNTKRNSLSILSPFHNDRNKTSSINDIAMKYRYENMKIAEIASLIDPKIRKNNQNLFEKLCYKGHHLDKDIIISQKILFDLKVKRLSQGDLSFNPFQVKAATQKPIDNTKEINKKGAEIALYYHNKIKKQRPENKKDYDNFSQKNRTFDSIIQFANDIENEPNHHKRIMLNGVHKFNKEKQSVPSISLMPSKIQLNKHFRANTDIKVVSTPVKEKELVLNKNCLKLKMNLLNEHLHQYNKYNEVLALTSQCLSENNKDVNTVLLCPVNSSNRKKGKNLTKRKDKTTSKSISSLAFVLSQESETPFAQLKNNLSKKFKLNKGLAKFNINHKISKSCKRNISHLIGSSSCEPTSTNWFSQIKRNETKVDTKQEIMDKNAIEEMNRIRHMNESYLVKYKKEKSGKEKKTSIID